MKTQGGTMRKALRAVFDYIVDAFARRVEVQRRGSGYVVYLTVGHQLRILEVPEESLLELAVSLNALRRTSRVLKLELRSGFVAHVLEVPRWAVPELRRLLVAEALAKAEEQEPEEDGAPCATT